MNRIEQTYLIAASPKRVWQELTDPVHIRKWSGAPAEFALQVNAPYSLWGGDICGRIVEFVPEQSLVQTWKPANWTAGNSVVRFTLTPVGRRTRVDLVHENVEESDYVGTSEGWDIYYLGVIKRRLESESKGKRAASTKAKTVGGQSRTARKPRR